ncbi:UDP-N-acetylglucosamine 1-carboxyvinyltransferase [Papillibacter cinnamivorans]|uniref:UDP-N-acetylglucosamine 1-carboxyvinyltransferase n=1 Tax=Papillibacter cinnamivorans DSM 12816 TaxID=1122930 RepID=A0A1W1Z0K0_9FIRM|nr:UDP-N-acetylglucosamine 1-carboxyvinyltransferase [Papillibacter cinnamivorans]SMC41488.1 UDP-N-acetylglucosamine 1-carboxyvinyltransferase [Papillibacter cinnamivorans DSM 12816]
MSTFLVNGGKQLYGNVKVHGAKNSVLPILAAAIVNPGESILHNCPDLSDVTASIKILEHLGCTVKRENGTIIIDSRSICRCDIPDELMREMRSSVIFLGAILARAGEAKMSFPGGCELGPRPIDLHLSSLRALGAHIEEKSGNLLCRADRMRGCEINLSIPSVGATENAMLAACSCEGTTTITNAAREPEITDLQNFLCSMGFSVFGAGGSTIVVEGKAKLHDCSHTVISDRIVAATYLTAVASAGGEVNVEDVDYRHLSTVTSILSEAGCRIRSEENSVIISCKKPLKAVRPVRTAPYPGFPTDAQAPLMAAMLCAEGTSVFIENIFENRYRHVDELMRMGADIKVEGRVAVVCGVPRLHGASIKATDLRGGAALVAAALGAEGESRISGISHIDRGYQSLERSLAEIGAEILRTDGP